MVQLFTDHRRRERERVEDGERGARPTDRKAHTHKRTEGENGNISQADRDKWKRKGWKEGTENVRRSADSLAAAKVRSGSRETRAAAGREGREATQPEKQGIRRRALAREAEHQLDAADAPLFLRFANLLMNDANYLLDESLRFMKTLKQMQAARDEGEWTRLEEQARAQQQANYQHHGRLARFHNVMAQDTEYMAERTLTVDLCGETDETIWSTIKRSFAHCIVSWCVMKQPLTSTVRQMRRSGGRSSDPSHTVPAGGDWR